MQEDSILEQLSDDSDQLSSRVFDPDAHSGESGTIGEYDLVSTPNDFNVLTIKNFLDTGAVKVPRYQRNFVWDRPRASKLIESLILGLPVPQVFLYEEARNSFQIIDGQQRLMSIYFFMVGRFPRRVAKPRLREYWGTKGAIPSEILHNDALFEPFRLHLPSSDGAPENPLHGLKYETLEDKQIQLGMRTLRNVIIKQINPEGRGAVYEIFNRLNTTGVNLTAQEIRLSLADSRMMEKIVEINASEAWRRFFGITALDPRLRDIEIILRAFAMADDASTYKPSMVRFLDGYADKTRTFSESEVTFRAAAFERFLREIEDLDRSAFLISNRFSVPVFEGVFAAYYQGICEDKQPQLDNSALQDLAADDEFMGAASTHTTDTKNVLTRIRRARHHIFGGEHVRVP